MSPRAAPANKPLVLLPLLLAAASAALASPPSALPRLALGQVSVSGISSGADLAVQLQVAFSDLIDGAGIFAGQAFHCATQRFPDDNLTSPNPSVPFCDGCPPGTTLGYDHCKRHPEVAQNISLLVEYARRQAAEGTIAPLTTLAERRVFLYRGTQDHTYNRGAVNATANFFRTFLPNESVYFEHTVQSAHLVPTIDPYLCWWEEWSGPDNCTFDGAGHVLRWVHGKNALRGGRVNTTETLHAKYMRDFDQTLYARGDALMASRGKVFVPPDCTKEGAACNVHIFFHVGGSGISRTATTRHRASALCAADRVAALHTRIDHRRAATWSTLLMSSRSTAASMSGPWLTALWWCIPRWGRAVTFHRCTAVAGMAMATLDLRTPFAQGRK
jgi:hypothetical protein